MANFVMLNNVQHFNLRAKNRYSAACGDNSAAVMTFPTEFADIQREYPIVFAKDSATGAYQAVALLGVQAEENLFLNETASVGSGWVGNYVPAIVARGPFIIGMPDDGDMDSAPVVFVDLDSSKVSESEGEALFLPMGGSSPYLDRIVRMLGVIQQGKAIGDLMYAQFDALNLFELVTIDAELSNGEKYRIENYYTINQERLANLNGSELEMLNRSGFLHGAFLVISSLSNVQKLIDIKNLRAQLGG